MVQCGNCGLEFPFKPPKSGTGELRGRDSDFCPHYRGPNPVLYRVVVCPGCHFAAYKDDFVAIEERSRQAVRDALESVGLPLAAEFGSERSLFAALRSYQLGLVCYAARRFPSETLGSLALRAAWICRYSDELWREQDYLEQALEHYLDAFERGARYDVRFDDLAIAYLVGDLLRRTGEGAKARGYFDLLLEAADTTPYLRGLASERIQDCRESERILSCLREVHAFKPLNTRSLALLAAYSSLQFYRSGALVYRRGDPGESMFCVAQGGVSVHLAEPGTSPAVAVLERPATFGELSLFSGAARGAAVVVEGDAGAELIEISRTAFRYLVKAEPRVAEQVALDVARRQARYAQLALDLLADEQARHAGSHSGLGGLVDRIRNLIAVPETALGPGA